MHVTVFPDWESLLEVDTLSKDYCPLPSKEFSLLFFWSVGSRSLVSSPSIIFIYNDTTYYIMYAHNHYLSCIRLGKSSSPFVWYIFRQFRTKVPSIATVKKFSLPGLVPPLKVALCEVKIWRDGYNFILSLYCLYNYRCDDNVVVPSLAKLL